MNANKLKNALIATASTGAMVIGLGIGPAAADPLPFTIDPNVLVTSGGPYATQVVTDLNGISSALIQQIGASTQREVGWLQGQGFTNNGPAVSSTLTRMVKEGDIGSPGTNVYNLYLLFTGTVTGIVGFGAGQTGTVGAGDYNFVLLADRTSDDVFTVASTSAGGGVEPTVSGAGLSDDLVLAVGSSLSGSVGFAPSTGAPFFNVLATFILCNGTPGQGTLGGVTMAAAACGSFDAATYFISPSPFYQLEFNSSISGSSGNLSGIAGGPPPNVTLNGIVADINFVQIPEPGTLGMFGLGLFGLGWFSRRRRNKPA